MQPKSIARRLAAAALLGVCLTQADTPVAQQGQSLTEAPGFVALFAPPSHASSYRAYVSQLPPADLLASLDANPALGPGFASTTAVGTPGAWQPQRESPLDAFGRAGTYNRKRLAKLFGSKAVTVARGARAADGRVIESWTLLSPYPDPSLTRLESGTLVLILKIP